MILASDSETSRASADQAQIATSKDVFVGRQPIYDRNLNLVAFELLFRSGNVGAANVVDGDEATFTVMLNALVEIGLHRLVGDKKAFINLTRNSVLCEYCQFFPRDQVVMEVLEDVSVDEELLGMVTKFTEMGFQIALDDFVYRDELAPLLEIAGIVKIDVQALPESEVREYVKQYGNLTLLAEKVETKAEFEFCRDLGFELFQGYFLSRPKVIQVKHVPTSQITTLRLLSALHQDGVTPAGLVDIIRQDFSLSYRLLRTADAARGGFGHKIGTVAEAVELLGVDSLQRWITLLSVSGMDDTPPELIASSMCRARMCESLARHVDPTRSEVYYMVGLLSELPSLIGTSTLELLEPLTLNDELTDALIKEKGLPREVLLCAIACEQESWNDATLRSVPPETIREAWTEATTWTRAHRIETGF